MHNPIGAGVGSWSQSVGHGELKFRVHGPDTATEAVSAALFASQLTTLVRALRAADRAVNGKTVHDYAIRHLRSSAPEAVLFERPLPRYADYLIVGSGRSGIAAFEDCIEAVIIGNDQRALSYRDCVKRITKFSDVGFSEIETEGEKRFRIDRFLTTRARAIVSPLELIVPGIEMTTASRVWFKGAARGSFDGDIKAVDLRGDLPQLKLVLTAGRSEIDCIFHGIDKEQIRAALDRRARVHGRAIYDGTSGLPQRVEVDKMEVVPNNGDLMRWRGAFEPFETDIWEDERE